ncbi:hypothetical protein GCM10010193_53820 [Kitasatospora atroaurantiaca]|uniref:Dolichyl-phosphate-mannose-protein mannosyltransferase n=1 Tax=Kitasatospora atroaurantiaca TaxID=285545 RepID=A0A561EQ36_9ACTN|nr:hypothetical protein [Kitasatospora atroaurantiaca]TWE17728.1 hypothetical protein FB465_2766 [Kitasatospora atroaurantiaca]
MPDAAPRRPARALPGLHRAPVMWRLPLGVLAGTQAIWLFWWAAFHPGLISYDSVMYTWQVTTGNWTSDHSVLYDALVWVTLHLPGRFALLTLLQTTAMSAALAYACVAMRDLGVRARWSVPAALAVAALPPTGTVVVFVWKDVPFYICAVLVFAATARLVAGRKRPRLSGRRGLRPGSVRFDLAVLTVGLLGLGLFRNNGLGLALLASAALVIALPGQRIKLGSLTAATVLIPLVAQLWLYPALGVKQPPSDSVFALNYSDVAVAYQQAPSLFSPADIAVLERVAPLSTWQQGANCHSADLLTNSWAPFDHAAAERYSGQLMGLWTKVLKQRPDVIVGARICRGHIAWAPTSDRGAAGATTQLPYLGTPADLWGWASPASTGDPKAGRISPNGKMAGSPYLPDFATHPLSTTAHKAALWLNNLFRVPQLDWLFWRGATWCYLIYAALACYAIGRRRPAVYALAGLLVGQQLTVLAANPVESYRYVAAPLFIGPFCLGLIAARRESSGTAPVPAPENRSDLHREHPDRNGNRAAGTAATRAPQSVRL